MSERERLIDAFGKACCTVGERSCGAPGDLPQAVNDASDARAALLAAPVEPAVAVDVTEKEEDDAVYLLGHRAGAEWMREQAAVQADVQAGSDSSGDEWDVAWNKSAEIVAKHIRSLPVSPPAPEEAKP